MKTLIIGLLLFIPTVVNGQIITTFGGTGTYGFSGDGGSISGATFRVNTDLKMDPSGNMYVVDLNNERVRKISAAGIITTVAGIGTRGYTGDGGPAILAQLSMPYGVSFDASGNIYIADYGNHCVRKVDTSGIITTVAGTGVAGNSGDGGPATSAEIHSPADVVVDPTGNIYISDQFSSVIRKVNTLGIISTVAGNGTWTYSGDGGLATASSLYQPTGLDIDGFGNLYIADMLNNRIRKVDVGGTITTVAGNGTSGDSGDGGPATSAHLRQPSDVMVDVFGNIYISDPANARVKWVSSSGLITTVVGTGIAGYSGDGGAATAAEIRIPSGLTMDGAGNLYISDRASNVIRKISTPTSINVLNSKNSFSLYPNPACDILNVSSYETISSITIRNTIGQVVYRNNYEKQKVEIDISFLVKGLYFVTICGGEYGTFFKQ